MSDLVSLAAEDRAIVEAINADVGAAQVPQLVAIHEERLAGHRRRLAEVQAEQRAIQRAIAMRTAALVILRGRCAPIEPVASRG